MNINEINFPLSQLILPVVTLIGPPGGGKTEVGSQLAADLGWTFWDTDVLIEQALGLTIPEIFAQYGQHTFRFSEKKLIEKIGRLYSAIVGVDGIDPRTRNTRADYIRPYNAISPYNPISPRYKEHERVQSAPAQGTIISTGGGLPVLGENLRILSRIGTLVTLSASIDVLSERTARKPNRPLLNPTGSSDPVHDQQHLKLLVEGRKHIYTQADISIDTSDLTIAAVAESIKKRLGLEVAEDF